LAEPDRRGRLHRAATALAVAYPEPAGRPSLYGALLAVKDIFHVDGFTTRAGATVPPELFAGPEAACVTRLRQAGALVVGKAVTTEFAYFEPGPTRNPHNLAHTPGGSSSGSAAAVAAGLAPLALGTQTIGSVIRPAAFCGIVGFKPSLGRVDPQGLVFFSRTLDQRGLFTQDVAGMALAAAVVCREWRDLPAPGRLPVLVGSTDTHDGFFSDLERSLILAPGRGGADLAEAVRRFEGMSFSTQRCMEHASAFDTAQFVRQWQQFVQEQVSAGPG
jgi:Asp-tRNA(Asn)/Glu-tRNA(Gln) amidotransferase A subunit family amidase